MYSLSSVNYLGRFGDPNGHNIVSRAMLSVTRGGPYQKNRDRPRLRGFYTDPKYPIFYLIVVCPGLFRWQQ